MTLEDAYKISKDNIRPSKYSEKTVFNVDHSRLNIDRIPSKYNTAGVLGNGKDSSKLNIDFTPKKYHG